MKGFVVVGSEGRMGKEIIEVLLQKGIPLVGKIDKGPNNQNYDNLSSKQIEALIDFSTPQSFEQALAWCVEKKVPFVSGTTGLDKNHHDLIKQAGLKIPCFWSANMSIGIYFLNSWLEQLSKLQEDFDFQIEEVHHKHKVDKPSGTAILLQNTLQSHINKKLPDPLSIRGGGVFGNHKILAMSEEEVLSIEHIALNRRVFAKGAVRAAQWLKDKPPGLYTMKDVLEKSN
jgi:4-hydroxy-tetrahydrodipicolinate reductase